MLRQFICLLGTNFLFLVKKSLQISSVHPAGILCLQETFLPF